MLSVDDVNAGPLFLHVCPGTCVSHLFNIL